MPIDTTSTTAVVGTVTACRDYVQLVHDASLSLSRDIELKLDVIRNKEHGENFIQAYVDFLRRVETFKDDVSCWWASDFEQAESLAREYNAFERQFVDLAGTAPSRPGAQRSGSSFPWGWMLFTVVALGAGYYAYRMWDQSKPAARRKNSLAGARSVNDLGSSGTTYYLEV